MQFSTFNKAFTDTTFNENIMFNIETTIFSDSDKVPITNVLYPFSPQTQSDHYSYLSEVEYKKEIASLNETFNKAIDKDVAIYLHDSFNKYDSFVNDYDQNFFSNPINFEADGDFFGLHLVDESISSPETTNKSDIPWDSKPQSQEPNFSSISNGKDCLEPETFPKTNQLFDGTDLGFPSTNPELDLINIYPQILSTIDTTNIPKYRLSNDSSDLVTPATELKNPIIHSDPIIPIVDSRFPMRTTFNYNNCLPVSTSFTFSVNSEIYRNPVQDGLIEPIAEEMYEPPTKKFKDNINLKLKLGKDYESIISRLSQSPDRTNYILPNCPPKKKNKLFQERRTGRPQINYDIAKSFELATNAIIKNNQSRYRKRIDTPLTIEESAPKSTSPMSLVKPPELESQSSSANGEIGKTSLPFPNIYEALKSRFTKSYTESITIEKVDTYCIDCKLELSNYWELALHLQSHTLKRDRPFQCPVYECPLNIIGFCQKASLAHHSYGAHFYRGEIKEEFVQWENELRKILFNCDSAGCGKAFSRRDSLARHNKVIHGIDHDCSPSKRHANVNNTHGSCPNLDWHKLSKNQTLNII